MNATVCRECGSTRVRWTTTKAGKRYMQNVTAPYGNGATYGRGPHAATCVGPQIKAHAAAQRVAHRKQACIARVAARMQAAMEAGEVTGQEAWATVERAMKRWT